MQRDNNERKKLLSMLEKYPDLDIIFMVDCNNLYDAYSSMLLEDFKCEINDVYEIDERVFIGEEDIGEWLSDNYADDDRYKNLSDDGYETVMKQKSEEFKKGEKIIIRVY